MSCRTPVSMLETARIKTRSLDASCLPTSHRLELTQNFMNRGEVRQHMICVERDAVLGRRLPRLFHPRPAEIAEMRCGRQPLPQSGGDSSADISIPEVYRCAYGWTIRGWTAARVQSDGSMPMTHRSHSMFRFTRSAGCDNRSALKQDVSEMSTIHASIADEYVDDCGSLRQLTGALPSPQ